MTEHIKVDESFIEGIVKQAAWDSLYDNDLSKEEETELTEETVEEVEEANKKLPPPVKVKVKTDDSPEGKKKQADADYDHERMLKMKQSAESVEVHECPLCESILEEELTDEQIMEHVASIQDALTAIEEAGKEPTDAELKDIDAEEPTDDYDDDDDLEETAEEDAKKGLLGKEQEKDKYSKKESVMLKVKELKRVAQEGYSDPNSGVAGEADRAD